MCLLKQTLQWKDAERLKKKQLGSYISVCAALKQFVIKIMQSNTKNETINNSNKGNNRQ